MSPRDGHVITVSGCLILTAVNSSSYGWLTKCLKFLQDTTFDISLHEVCVRVGVRYDITKFSRMDILPNFLTLHGAPQARASSAINNPQPNLYSGDTSIQQTLATVPRVSPE